MKKTLLMKQLVFLSVFSMLLISENSGQKTLPVYDGISYTAGTLVYDATNWWVLNSTAVNDVAVTAGSLTYTGLRESAGNKISIGGDGDDFVIWFGDQPTDSKTYYSLIFQVTGMSGISAGTTAYFAGFSNNGTTGSSNGCGIYFQVDAINPAKFNIGHGTRAASTIVPVWNTSGGSPVQYSVNTPIFVVGCYEAIGVYTAGVPNDKSSLWINPSAANFEDLLPPAASINTALTGTAPNDVSVVNRFFLRQDLTTNNPAIEVDEIRIGLTWSSVTPKALSTSAGKILSEGRSANIYPNPVKDNLKVDISGSDISNIEIFNITGVRVLSRILDQGVNNVNVSDLPQGAYIVKLKGSGTNSSGKFIKN
ncbi:MAG: T9SS type A sorting domain-containing protein [Bacteroidia bacterium]|nr:T9SS type A sorting domain-containing protein [Bacteroidia bacterium]